MTPTGTSLLANDFNKLTTKSEGPHFFNDCSVPYGGKRVEQNNPGNGPEIDRTNSAIPDQGASKLESRVITPLEQANPQTQVPEPFSSTDEYPVDASNPRSKLTMAFSKNDLSLAREVATLPEAKAFLIELFSGNHPPARELVTFLLQAGVDPDAGESGEKTPLYLAAKALSSKEVDQGFVDNPAWFTKTYNLRDGYMPNFSEDYDQYHNKMKNWVGLAKELLAAGANPDPMDKEGYTPLTLLTARAAPEKGYPYCAELFEYLLNTAKADPNGNASGKQTPLYAAAGSHVDSGCVQMLLTAGADVNAGAKGRDTPLYAASARRLGAKIVLVLLEARAKPNADSTGMNTPLYGAIVGIPDTFEDICSRQKSPYVENRFTVINHLLDYGADANAKASGKQTPLYAAATAYESDRGLVKLLLNNHADPNGNAKGEETPLRHVLDTIVLKKRKWEALKVEAERIWFHRPEQRKKADKAEELFKKSIDLAIEDVISPLAECRADPDAGAEQEKDKPRSIAELIGDKKLSICLAKMNNPFSRRL